VGNGAGGVVGGVGLWIFAAVGSGSGVELSVVVVGKGVGSAVVDNGVGLAVGFAVVGNAVGTFDGCAVGLAVEESITSDRMQ